MNYSIDPQFCMPLYHWSVFLATWTVQHLTRRFQPWDFAGFFFFFASFQPTKPTKPNGLRIWPKDPHHLQTSLFSAVFKVSKFGENNCRLQVDSFFFLIRDRNLHMGYIGNGWVTLSPCRCSAETRLHLDTGEQCFVFFFLRIGSLTRWDRESHRSTSPMFLHWKMEKLEDYIRLPWIFMHQGMKAKMSKLYFLRFACIRRFSWGVRCRHLDSLWWLFSDIKTDCIWPMWRSCCLKCHEAFFQQLRPYFPWKIWSKLSRDIWVTKEAARLLRCMGIISYL